MESDCGTECYNSVFQNSLKNKNLHLYSTFTDKGPSVAERVIRMVQHLLKKPVFGKGNADWVLEVPSVIKNYNNTNHNSIKKNTRSG